MSFFYKIVITEFSIPGFIGNKTLLARPLPISKWLYLYIKPLLSTGKVFCFHSEFRSQSETKNQSSTSQVVILFLI